MSLRMKAKGLRVNSRKKKKKICNRTCDNLHIHHHILLNEQTH